MPNLDAPARLAFWPQRPWDEGSDYDTLRQALADAAQHPSETPWIVTQSGKILKPREVADLISMLRGDESDSGIRCFSWLKMRFERGPKPGSMPKPMSLKLRRKMAGWSSDYTQTVLAAKTR